MKNVLKIVVKQIEILIVLELSIICTSDVCVCIEKDQNKSMYLVRVGKDYNHKSIKLEYGKKEDIFF